MAGVDFSQQLMAQNVVNTAPQSGWPRDARPLTPAGDGIALSIIIVNWNSKDYTRKCLQSVCAHTRDLSYEIIVVDSASYDGCGEMLAREFPGVRFIQCEQNVGFARANNLGARQARGACLLFLNPDTELANPAVNLLFVAVNKLENAGAVGARLLNTDRTVQTSCIQSFPTVPNQALDCELFRRWFPRSSLWGMAALFDGSRKPAVVEAIIGACIMIKRTVFQQIQGFDESYFMYAEDMDLCFKVHQAGFKCWLLPAAEIIHHGGGSSKSARNDFSVVMMRESIHRLLQCRQGGIAALGYRVAMGFSALLRIPILLIGIMARKMAGRPVHTTGFWKWLAILRWSLGGEGWAKAGAFQESPKPQQSLGPGKAHLQSLDGALRLK